MNTLHFNHPIHEFFFLLGYEKTTNNHENHCQKEEMKHKMEISFKQTSRCKKKYRQTKSETDFIRWKQKEEEYQNYFNQYWYYKNE